MSETETKQAPTQDEWWSTGYDEMDSIPEGSSDDRHYMKAGTERTVLFLDGSPTDREIVGRPYGAPFCIWEYQIPQNEDGGTNWRYWATCVRGRKDANGNPMVDFVKKHAPDMKPYYVGFFTIVDVTEVNLQDHIEKGTPLPESCYIKLLPAKRKLLKVLKRHAAKKKGLRACVYTVYRGSNEDPNTGNDWQCEEKLSEEDLKTLLPDGRDAPRSYHELLAPLPEEEVEGLMPNRAKVTPFDKKGKKDDGGGRRSGRSGRGRRRDQEDADDVPF
jgi:hypothetical protein